MFKGSTTAWHTHILNPTMILLHRICPPNPPAPFTVAQYTAPGVHRFTALLAAVECPSPRVRSALRFRTTRKALRAIRPKKNTLSADEATFMDFAVCLPDPHGEEIVFFNNNIIYTVRNKEGSCCVSVFGSTVGDIVITRNTCSFNSHFD